MSVQHSISKAIMSSLEIDIVAHLKLLAVLAFRKSLQPNQFDTWYWWQFHYFAEEFVRLMTAEAEAVEAADKAAKKQSNKQRVDTAAKHKLKK